jgi:hypothetical protein
MSDNKSTKDSRSTQLDTGEKDPMTNTSIQPLYFPLLDGKLIRLLELAPGTWHEQVSVRMLVVELGHHLKYDALSYVWGDPKNPATILCNGREMKVTRGLHTALTTIRYLERPRIVWADAVCINQEDLKERSYQVSFMGSIYRHAIQVLVCVGPDPDGGAADVAALVEENAALVSRYHSILDMPILSPDNTLFEDPRWKSLSTFMERPWFTRAWVLQEVGLAKDPRVYYGNVEFKYRDLMTLGTWDTRRAPHLQARTSVSFYDVHKYWQNWLPGWEESSVFPNATLLDLLSDALWLSCQDWRDHVYALIGHPLAQLENGHQTIVKPDYSKPMKEVYLELARNLLDKEGYRLLSAVEHDHGDLLEGFSSWVPFSRKDVEFVSCSLGIGYDFWYNASAAAEGHPLIILGTNNLLVRGAVVDTINMTYQFPNWYFEEVAPEPLDISHRKTLEIIWKDIHEDYTHCAYNSWEISNAFSLSICAGLSTYKCAEENLVQHEEDFAAYWNWKRSVSPVVEECSAPSNDLPKRGAQERFVLDMERVCDGRSFLFTEKGYYGLGPSIAKRGDLCCVLFGAKVPFLLRRFGEANHYKLIGECYIHGIMRGEAVAMTQNNLLSEEFFIIC